MPSNQYLYQKVKDLALTKRKAHNIISQDIDLTSIRKIYKSEGIRIKLCNGKLRNLRALYMSDDLGCDVLLNNSLPREAKIFSLLHELKHHYCDSQVLGQMACLNKYDIQPEIEISAEVFAAEFIWPEFEFLNMVNDFGISRSNLTPELLVAFKRQASIPVSYTFLKKRFEFNKFISSGQFDQIKFQNLEESIYGQPYWKRRK